MSLLNSLKKALALAAANGSSIWEKLSAPDCSAAINDYKEEISWVQSTINSELDYNDELLNEIWDIEEQINEATENEVDCDVLI